MKRLKKILAVALALVMVLGLATQSSAVSGGDGLADLPEGVYTYVDTAPSVEAGAATGQIQFLYWLNSIVWDNGEVNKSLYPNAEIIDLR